MFRNMQNSDLEMIELSEAELTEITGDGGFGGCGGCGFSTGPFISSFANECANTFAASTSVAASNVNRTSAFTLFN